CCIVSLFKTDFSLARPFVLSVIWLSAMCDNLLVVFYPQRAIRGNGQGDELGISMGENIHSLGIVHEKREPQIIVVGKNVYDFHVGVDLRGGVCTLISHQTAVARNHAHTAIHNTAVDLDVEQLPSDGGELRIDGSLQRTAAVLDKPFAQFDELFKLADPCAVFLLLTLQCLDALLGVKT